MIYKNRPKLAFVIHDINPYGGQERSTLEIIERLATSYEIHVFSNTAQGLPKSVIWRKVFCGFKRPVFIKDFVFRLFVTFQLLIEKFDLIHATGTCSFVADVVTIQFCQARWAHERKFMPKLSSIRKLKEDIQMLYDLACEKIVLNILKKSTYVAISEIIANDLKTHYNLAKIILIPHGVNTQTFNVDPAMRLRIRRELNMDEHELIFLFVGTYLRKGLYPLIESLNGLPPSLKFKLIVAGDGPVASTQRLIDSRGLKDRVRLIGSTKTVENYFKSADLFILPSLYDPFGLVGIEALACGVPTIASKQSGVSDLISEGHNGYVIDEPTSTVELTRLLDMATSDLLHLGEMKIRARDSVLKYDWDHVVENYKNFISNTLERSTL